MATNADEDVPRIHKLDETVVNRIAAGEVVQRPANAIKEMLENSLDAGSTSIIVTVKQGGLQLLQIQDDGHGIKVEDFPILCERFTTSKLRTYDDLKSISSFGFRGEALASISHVAHLTITSKTKNSPCAYRARFSDGLLVPFKPGDKEAKPQPCAGVNGTIITVEDLFFNMATRRNALKNPGDQYRAILDVVTRYSIHYAGKGISFTCKKHGQAGADLYVPKNTSTIDAIKIAFGGALSKELLPFELEYKALEGKDGDEELDLFSFGRFEVKATGYISNANYNMKKSVFMLFINNRLVDSAAIKKVFDTAYAEVLPHGSHPFVYLSLHMPPQFLDVNVHPTKREVHFLHEDFLLEKLGESLDKALQGANTSRVFYGQALITGPKPSKKEEEREEDSDQEDKDEERVEVKVNTAPPKLAPCKMIRTDAFAGNIKAYFLPGGAEGEKKGVEAEEEEGNEENEEENSDSQETGCKKRKIKSLVDGMDHGERRFRSRMPSIVETKCNYHSVQALIADIKDRTHQGMLNMLKRHTFVGVVDTRLSLIQHNTGLIMVKHLDLSKELFYQLAIRRFGCMDKLMLAEPAPVCEMLRLALDLEDVGWQPEDGDKDELAKGMTSLLMEKRQMLDEYFRLEFDAEKETIVAVPDLLQGYTPSPTALPLFLVRLATTVDWDDEQRCFEGVANEISEFYSDFSRFLDEETEEKGGEASIGTRTVPEKYEHFLQHVIYPGFRGVLLPPRDLAEAGVVTQLASLEQLYKVFERC